MSMLLSRAAGLKHLVIAGSSIWYALLIGIAMLLLGRSEPGEQRRERNFDLMLASLKHAPSDAIVIVDIDRQSLAAMGQWPWSRDKFALLIAAIADARPRSIGIDTLIEGPDERSPAALARRLAEMTGRDDIGRLGDTLTDGDRQLAAALRKAPTSLGVALRPTRADDWGPAGSVLIRGQPRTADFWHGKGIVGPAGPLAEAASGLGVLFLPGDADGRVRRAPLLVVVGQRLWPSLAVDVVRNHDGASAVLLSADTGSLEIAARAVPISNDGMLRLLPLRHDHWADRTVSAVDVLEKPEARQRLTGRIILVGSSAPELGGLRAAVSAPLAPSVLLHAAAVEQILAGTVPIRSRWIEGVEVAAAIAACVLATLLAHVLSPLMGSLVAGALAVLWVVGAPVLLWRQHLLVDPFLVPAIIVTCFTTAGFLTAAASKRRERALRLRFEQHLAPEVVRRLSAQPGLLRLEGETREITALFTDVEGFTAMTERIDARTLVGLLDRYFEGLTHIVVEHGGMVEKIVGDGLHAIFNAPLDLADHPRRAVDCAIALRDFGVRFRTDTQAAAAGFGRTRVGLETGVVVVGDVGGSRKLDYTAHGEAMNMAARFEAANKELGSSICIGPATAARFPNRALRPLGRIEVRGRSVTAEVFDPWPEAMDKSDRKTYLKAVALADRDPMAAAERFDQLTDVSPGDAVPAKYAARLRITGIAAQLAEFDRRRRPSLAQPIRPTSKKKRG